MTQTDRVMTVEEFLQLPESNTPAELIDGEMIMAPAPYPVHQIVVSELFRMLDRHIKAGRLLFAPADVKLGENVVQPDIFWIQEGGACQIAGSYWQGAPDFVAEVLSPSTAKRDRGEKFRIYEQAGVREYWLIDPDAQFIEVYVRHDEAFQRQGIYDGDDTFTSTLFEGEFTADEVFS